MWTMSYAARKSTPRTIDAKSIDELVQIVQSTTSDVLEADGSTDQVDFYFYTKDGRRRRFAIYMAE